jgi:hypothetical protein
MFLEQHPGLSPGTFTALPQKVAPRVFLLAVARASCERAQVANCCRSCSATGQEEVLRLASPDESGVGDALTGSRESSDAHYLEALLATRTRLDAKGSHHFSRCRRAADSADSGAQDLGQLAGFSAERLSRSSWRSFGAQASSWAPTGVPPVPSPKSGVTPAGPTAGTAVPLAALRALREMGSGQAELFAMLAKSSTDPVTRDEALHALAASKSDSAGKLVFELWPELTSTQRRAALERLASTRSGARSIVTAVRSGALPKSELDGPSVERMQAVLGEDTDFLTLMQELDEIFRPVLAGWSTTRSPIPTSPWRAHSPSKRGRLDAGIGNQDGISRTVSSTSNFMTRNCAYGSVAACTTRSSRKKPVVPMDHVAVTRNDEGFLLYI